MPPNSRQCRRSAGPDLQPASDRQQHHPDGNAGPEEGPELRRVEPRITRNERGQVVDIEFAIVRGERIFVERIDIEGNTTTLDQVIRRQFRTVEGDPFNPREIRQAAERIRALGFFADAQVDARPGLGRPGRGQRRRRGTADRLAVLRSELFGRLGDRRQRRLLGNELPWARPASVAVGLDRGRQPELQLQLHRTRASGPGSPLLHWRLLSHDRIRLRGL
jgi:hypothetical protein